MEEVGQDENKGSLAAQAYELLYKLQDKHSPGDTTFYLRRSDYRDKKLLELDLDKIRFLENQDVWKRSDYVRPATGAVDPNVIAVHLTPKGERVLKSRTTVTKTETTVHEVFEEPKVQVQVKRKQLDFRGRAGPIRLARLKELEIDINDALNDLRDPNRKYAKGARMYLRLVLKVRGEDLERERPELYSQVVERFRGIMPVGT